MQLEFQKSEREETGKLEKIIKDSFPKLMKTINPQTQEAQQIPSKTKPQGNRPFQACHYCLLKISNKVTKETRKRNYTEWNKVKNYDGCVRNPMRQTRKQYLLKY